MVSLWDILIYNLDTTLFIYMNIWCTMQTKKKNERIKQYNMQVSQASYQFL